MLGKIWFGKSLSSLKLLEGNFDMGLFPYIPKNIILCFIASVLIAGCGGGIPKGTWVKQFYEENLKWGKEKKGESSSDTGKMSEEAEKEKNKPADVEEKKQPEQPLVDEPKVLTEEVRESEPKAMQREPAEEIVTDQEEVAEETVKEEAEEHTEAVISEVEEKSSMQQPAISADGKHTIMVLKKTYKFEPSQITIRAGETVTWLNKDNKKHNFVSVPDGSGEEPEIFHLAAPGDEWSHTFFDAGEYPYFCFIHQKMVGKIIVVEE